MNAEQFRGSRLVSVCALEYAFDELLLKLADGFVEQNAAFHHLSDKPFQLISHVRTPHR